MNRSEPISREGNRNFCLSILLSIFLWGCATPAVVKDVHRQTPLTVAPNQESKPIQFKKIVIKLNRGQPIGVTQSGLLCIPKTTISWKSGARISISDEELTDIFREEFEKANFKIVGNPNALFDDPSEWKAELLVAGLVNDIKMNVCYPLGGFFNFQSAKGECYMKVNWQIYSKLDRKVVYEVTTEGSYKSSETKDDEGISIWHNAFAMAVNNLLADKGFYDLVVGERKLTPENTFKKVFIKRTPIFTSAITEHVNDIRLSVVTVRSKGHGSGFFISSEGYLLTNQHVVGESKFVKVILTTGREILGEVVRTNNRRDVALIKVEEKQMFALPILGKELDIGNEVFAIGSPLDEKLQTTISKGIISSYRVEDNLKYIQSDVNVLPGNSGGPLIDSKGNVVGMTVSGIQLKGVVPTGLNFFIPIQEVLNALNIEIRD